MSEDHARNHTTEAERFDEALPQRMDELAQTVEEMGAGEAVSDQPKTADHDQDAWGAALEKYMGQHGGCVPVYTADFGAVGRIAIAAERARCAQIARTWKCDPLLDNKMSDEPDGFRLEYRADTGETAIIFKLREPGILSISSSWQPSSPFTASVAHQRQLFIENGNGT